MELESLKDIITSSDSYQLEPYDTWQENFIFWLNKYIHHKATTATSRQVYDSNNEKKAHLIESIHNAKNIEDLRKYVNALERIRFKAPQTHFNNIKPLYDFLAENNAVSIKNITNKTLSVLTKHKFYHLKAATYNNKKTGIFNFINFIEERNIGDGSGGYAFNLKKKFMDDERPAKTKKKLVVLSPFEDYITFFDAIDQCDFKSDYNIRNRLILKLLMITGLRVTELTSLTNDRVIISDKTVTLKVIGKGDKERIVTFELQPIRRLWTEYNKLDNSNNLNLFVCSNSKKEIDRKYIQHLIQKVLSITSIKVSKESPHMLRHSYACYTYYTANIRLEELKNLLGHEDIATTQIYLHYFEDVAKSSGIKLSSRIMKDLKAFKQSNKKVA